MINEKTKLKFVKKEVSLIEFFSNYLSNKLFKLFKLFFKIKQINGNNKKKTISELKKISAKYLISLLNSDEAKNYCMLDLRNREDFFKDHVVLLRKGITINVPLKDFNDSKVNELKRFLHKTIVVYGYGKKDYFDSVFASNILKSKGFHVLFLDLGYEGYREELYG